MMYYVEQPHQYADHNRLEGAVKEMLAEYDRFVFLPNRLEAIKASIQRGVDHLNKANPRCNPLPVIWIENHSSGGKAVKAMNFKTKHSEWTLFLSPNHYCQALIIRICREEKDL